jgi:hydroxymethylpyrimidine/phosphomethylpyrimidine kinase
MKPIALTIAGSDSGGGAGIQADLKTFQAFGVFGTSAVTAVTAQNTRGVGAVQVVSPDLVVAQMHAVAEDLRPAACKTGMLGDAATVEAVAGAIRGLRLEPLVVDPVVFASSGDRLLEPDGVAALARLLIPLATLVTPNLAEAALLADLPEVRDEAGMETAARAIVAQGAGAALVKGGHLGDGSDTETLVDILFDGRSVHRWEHRRIASRHTHGTGCALSAAVTAGLAWRRPLHRAAGDAVAYVHRAIAAAPGLGAGHGPIEHAVTPVRAAGRRRSRGGHAAGG